MSIQIKVPAMGESVTEATIGKGALVAKKPIA